MFQARRVGLHYLHCGAECVGHIHHVHQCAGLEGTFEFLAVYGVVVDVYGIVSGAAPRRGNIADKARETHGAGIDAEAFCVVVAEELAGDFCDAIHRFGTLDGILRGFGVGCGVAEAADGAGGEYGATFLASHFEGVEESAETDFPGELRLHFRYGAEEGREVVDGVYFIAVYRVGYLSGVGDVYYGGGS